MLYNQNVRRLTEAEVEKWVNPFEKLLGEAERSPFYSTEILNNVFKNAYENGELPYEICVSTDTFSGMLRTYFTNYPEEVLGWIPASKRDTKEHEFKVGDIVQHFKRETLNAEELLANKYLYKIIAFAEHTETKEPLVVYQALYAPFLTYARPREMFCSEVDRNKYPHIKQKYRLEHYEARESR